jgi:hypothetical protein
LVEITEAVAALSSNRRAAWLTNLVSDAQFAS